MKLRKLAALSFVLVLASGCNKSQPTQAEWKKGRDDGVQGWSINQLVNTKNAMIVASCQYSNVPASVDLFVDGKRIDEKKIKYKIDGSAYDGDHIDSDCKVCSDNFANFWEKLKSAKSVEVNFDGNTEFFNITNNSNLPNIGGADSVCQTSYIANSGNSANATSQTQTLGSSLGSTSPTGKDLIPTLTQCTNAMYFGSGFQKGQGNMELAEKLNGYGKLWEKATFVLGSKYGYTKEQIAQEFQKTSDSLKDFSNKNGFSPTLSMITAKIKECQALMQTNPLVAETLRDAY